MLIDIKMKNIAELGHNGRLKIYVDPKKFTSTHAFKSISKMAGYIWLKFCMKY